MEATEVSHDTWRAWSERVSEWLSPPSADNAFRPLPFRYSASLFLSDSAVTSFLSISLSFFLSLSSDVSVILKRTIW